MNTVTRRTALVCVTACAVSTPTWAQNAPLRVILPLSAGSGVDVIVRTAQAALSKALKGQPVKVENIPGAGAYRGPRHWSRPRRTATPLPSFPTTTPSTPACSRNCPTTA